MGFSTAVSECNIRALRILEVYFWWMALWAVGREVCVASYALRNNTGTFTQTLHVHVLNSIAELHLPLRVSRGLHVEEGRWVEDQSISGNAWKGAFL